MSENGRSDAREPGSELVPGTSLVMHRFPRGSLAGVPWIGADGVPVETVHNGAREIALAVSQWSEDLKLRGPSGAANIFDRNAYVPPDNVFAQMVTARKAVENDDTVGGLADTTEGLALRKVHWESTDLDEADVFNQWSAEVDLDSFIRTCWRELYTHSQYIAARWWGVRTYKVRGRGAPSIDETTGKVKRGQKRKKTYTDLVVPVGLTVLDSTKVIPMGSLMFGQEQLVWTASQAEMQAWSAINSGAVPASQDPIMANFFLGLYTPSDAEVAMLRTLGITSTENLLLLNPKYVWRHTLTRPHYKPWADVRLKRVFRWLDMKQQLMAADRVALVGQANYILLVRKGEKDAPAKAEELAQLNDNFAYIARLPVVIGDHTLQIDIITPKQDFTLQDTRYNVIDTRIRESVLQTFKGESHAGRETATTLSRAVARGLENRRHGIKRDFEANLARQIYLHPLNAGQFAEDEEPNLVYSPRNLQLDQDPQTLQALIALSARGDVSRATTLEEVLDLDEETEALRREMEAQWYDPIFQTAVPFNGNQNPFQPDGGPGNNGGGLQPAGAGGGGRPLGGGGGGTPSPANPSPARAPRGTNR